MTDPFSWRPMRRDEKVDGGYRVTVTPPSHILGKNGKPLPPQSVTLTISQYARYTRWLKGDLLLQQLLPELSSDNKEILLSGIGPKDWDALFGDEK